MKKQVHRDRHPTARAGGRTDGRGRKGGRTNTASTAFAASKGRRRRRRRGDEAGGERALCASDPLSAFSRAASSAPPLSFTLRPVLASLARYSLLSAVVGKLSPLFPFFHRPSVRQSTEIRETRVDSFILNNKEGRVGPVTAVRGSSEWEERTGRRSVLSRSVPRTFEPRKKRRRDRLSSIHSIRPR